MRFIPKEKLGKKARRALDCAKRQTWGQLNPVTRKAGNKKKYDRKKSGCRFDDYGSRIFVCTGARLPASPEQMRAPGHTRLRPIPLAALPHRSAKIRIHQKSPELPALNPVKSASAEKPAEAANVQA